MDELKKIFKLKFNYIFESNIDNKYDNKYIIKKINIPYIYKNKNIYTINYYKKIPHDYYYKIIPLTTCFFKRIFLLFWDIFTSETIPIYPIGDELILYYINNIKNEYSDLIRILNCSNKKYIKLKIVTYKNIAIDFNKALYILSKKYKLTFYLTNKNYIVYKGNNNEYLMIKIYLLNNNNNNNKIVFVNNIKFLESCYDNLNFKRTLL